MNEYCDWCKLPIGSVHPDGCPHCGFTKSIDVYGNGKRIEEPTEVPLTKSVIKYLNDRWGLDEEWKLDGINDVADSYCIENVDDIVGQPLSRNDFIQELLYRADDDKENAIQSNKLT